MIEKTRRTYLIPNLSEEVFWKGKKGRGALIYKFASYVTQTPNRQFVLPYQ